MQDVGTRVQNRSKLVRILGATYFSNIIYAGLMSSTTSHSEMGELENVSKQLFVCVATLNEFLFTFDLQF